MSLSFEWDAEKAIANERKHGGSFDEGATAFGDPLSVTMPDPDHSEDEGRFILMGSTYLGSVLVVVHTDRGYNIRTSAPGGRPDLKGASMKTEGNDSDDMRDEYDFSTGVRGKYATRFAEGSNVVVLDPDVADLFTDSESVNDALRTLAEIAAKQSKKATG